MTEKKTKRPTPSMRRDAISRKAGIKSGSVGEAQPNQESEANELAAIPNETRKD
jgi:hypothetical protein